MSINEHYTDRSLATRREITAHFGESRRLPRSSAVPENSPPSQCRAGATSIIPTFHPPPRRRDSAVILDAGVQRAQIDYSEPAEIPVGNLNNAPARALLLRPERDFGGLLTLGDG